MRRVGFGLTAALAAGLFALGALAGCASSGGQAADGLHTASLGQADQGRRIAVPAGSTVTVRLDSTYWRFQPPSSRVLRLLGVTSHRGAHGVPGSGQGTVVARYRAVAPGQAVLAATRRLCGEALACGPGQRTYRVTVVVRG